MNAAREAVALPWGALQARLAGLGNAGLADFCRAHGIDGRAARRVLVGRRCNASTYLQLCCALGLDPVGGGDRAPHLAGTVLWWFLGAALTIVLRLASLSVREAETLAKRGRLARGLTATTIHRVAHGEPVSAENLVAVCAFVGQRPECFTTCFTANTNCNSLKNQEAA